MGLTEIAIAIAVWYVLYIAIAIAVWYVLFSRSAACITGSPENNVSQPFLQYSESLSDALICYSANVTNNQNTARRLFVPVSMAG